MWSLTPTDRRRLIVASLRDRYEQAMERLKEAVKQYNMARESYEVYRVVYIHVAISIFLNYTVVYSCPPSLHLFLPLCYAEEMAKEGS